MAVSGGLSAGSRRGARGAHPLLFLDPKGARRAEKKFLRLPPPTYLRVWMTAPPLCEGLDPPLDCNQVALKKERERELMLLKLYSIIFCTDLVMDIDIDKEKVYLTTRYTGVATR